MEQKPILHDFAWESTFLLQRQRREKQGTRNFAEDGSYMSPFFRILHDLAWESTLLERDMAADSKNIPRRSAPPPSKGDLSGRGRAWTNTGKHGRTRASVGRVGREKRVHVTSPSTARTCPRFSLACPVWPQPHKRESRDSPVSLRSLGTVPISAARTCPRFSPFIFLSAPPRRAGRDGLAGRGCRCAESLRRSSCRHRSDRVHAPESVRAGRYHAGG